jgi:hypothetical protein
MSRFDTMASASSWAPAGTITHQLLRRRHHAADGVHRELLHGPVDRRGQRLKLAALLGLDKLLVQARGLLLRFGEIVEVGAIVFRLGLPPLLA